MLRRNSRIQGRERVTEILKKGEAKRSPLFVVRTLPNSEPRNRFGIVISGKMEKSAVKRNKKRRQIFEIIRQIERQKIDSEPTVNSDMMLLARRPLATASYDDIRRDLNQLFKKLHNL